MKNKILTITFCIIIFLFSSLNLLSADKEISETERRNLTQFPTLSIDSILDKSFVEKFEKYSLDQFVFRDSFRYLKAQVNNQIYQKLDNNGIYSKNGVIFKRDDNLNLNSINNFASKINNIVDYLSPNNSVYYAIIPQKEYYMTDSLYHNINYDEIFELIDSKLELKTIDLRDILKIDDYFKTDTHWKQENIVKVADKILRAMNNNYTEQIFQEKTIQDFYGVYHGQAALKNEPENLNYLTNQIIEDADVQYFENKELSEVYVLDNVNRLDKYDIFLDGASSFIEITNPHNTSGKELVIFRDSFGSSLTPLLINTYSKITLIDTRYIASQFYLDLIEFTDQDILFLYSTMLVNNSGTLKD